MNGQQHKRSSLTKEWNNVGTDSMNLKLSFCKKYIITNDLIQKITSIFFLTEMEHVMKYDNLNLVLAFTLCFVSFKNVCCFTSYYVLLAVLYLYSKHYPFHVVHLKVNKGRKR